MGPARPSLAHALATDWLPTLMQLIVSCPKPVIAVIVVLVEAVPAVAAIPLRAINDDVSRSCSVLAVDCERQRPGLRVPCFALPGCHPTAKFALFLLSNFYREA